MKQIESLFWGVIAALGALVAQIFLYLVFSGLGNQANSLPFEQVLMLPQFILGAALLEEIFKYIMIAKRIDLFSLEKTYVVNSFLVGFGFFLVELFIISKNSTVLPPTQFIFEIAILHVGTAGLIGYLVAILNPKKISTFVTAISVAAFFHAAYNFLALSDHILFKYATLGLLAILVFLNILNFFRISSRLAQE